MRITILAVLVLFGCDYSECIDPIACEQYPSADHVVTISAACAEVGAIRDCGRAAEDGTPIVACMDYEGRPVGGCTTAAIVANSGTDHSLCAAECP
jgi:hypothetical protein